MQSLELNAQYLKAIDSSPTSFTVLLEEQDKLRRDMRHFYVQPMSLGNLCETCYHTSTLLSLLLQSCIGTLNTLPPGLLRPAPVCRALCLATWSPFSCTLILWEFGKSEWLVKQEAPCPCQMGSDWNYTVGHDGVRGEPAKELMADEDEDAW